MARLRRVDCSGPGIARKGRGRGFEYFDAVTGAKVTDPDTLQRIRDLAIPPAWTEVWICPVANGHLQAVGTDAAGRRQYLYHDAWRARRDAEKFDRMLDFARTLPRLRAVCAERLEGGDELTRERVLACAVRLLDQGFFRIGTEAYAEANDSFGIATLRREHASVDGDTVVFDYPAKGGKQRVQGIVDPAVRDIVERLKRRRSGPADLLCYRAGGRWVDLTSRDVSDAVKDVCGPEHSAKDFRTWTATVLAAVAVAVSGAAATSETARDRAVTRAVAEVAHYLGNTPVVARSAYIDPRVFDRYRSGWTIAGVLDDLGAHTDLGAPSIQGRVEEAVLDLLEERTSADGVEKIAS
jgi:DNA topoisomerase I